MGIDAESRLLLLAEATRLFYQASQAAMMLAKPQVFVKCCGVGGGGWGWAWGAGFVIVGYGLPFVIVRISSPGVPSTRGESGFWIAGLRLGGGCCRVCRFALPIVVSFCDEGISCQ